MAELVLCTRIEMIRLSACVSLPVGEDDALRGLVADGRLGLLGIRGRRIGDVTKVWSRTENLKCYSPRAPSLGAQR